MCLVTGTFDCILQEFENSMTAGASFILEFLDSWILGLPDLTLTRKPGCLELNSMEACPSPTGSSASKSRWIKTGLSIACAVLCGAALDYVSGPVRALLLEREAHAVLRAVTQEPTAPYRGIWLEYGIRKLVKACELDPLNQSVRLLLGTAYLLDGRLEPALDSFKNAERIRRDPRVYTDMAFCYMQMREWQRARDCLELALSFKPDFQDALDYLAELNKRKPVQ